MIAPLTSSFGRRLHNTQQQRHTYCYTACGVAAALAFLLILLQELHSMEGRDILSICMSPLRTFARSQKHRFYAADGTPLIIDPERTLWMAGWHARFSRYYPASPPVITWTIEAEEYVDQEYRRLHFPPLCSQVKGTRG